MSTRILTRRLLQSTATRPALSQAAYARRLASSNAARKPSPVPPAKPPAPAPAPSSAPLPETSTPTRDDLLKNSPLHDKTWMARYLLTHPAAMERFKKVVHLLGLDSPKVIASNRSLTLYANLIATAPDLEREFWQNECHLPPTFQSWFTVTNLHVWLLTVRLRALPGKLGKVYVQALIDQYFADIEDRIRNILQPQWKPPKPYTFHSSFYVNPNAPSPQDSPDNKTLSRAPDKIVTRHLKIFREQWSGLGISMDIALVKGDMEMAGAIWRNILGARGAKGIALPGDSVKFRRSVNLIGSEVQDADKVNFDEEELRDDGSGVHDFPPEESDKYVAYPELMRDLVVYARKELSRLEKIPDEAFYYAPLEELAFGRVREDAKKRK